MNERTRVIFIANPNNPTGTWVPGADLVDFLQQVPSTVWVVLDEAYLEYMTADDYIDGVALLKKFPNLILTRTFSKVYGLAAVRLGYGVSSPEFADLLEPRQAALQRQRPGHGRRRLAALADEEYVRESVEMNRQGMQQMIAGLTDMGYSYIPSAGNFVSFDCGEPGPDVFQRLLQQGVIVRPIAEYGLPNHIRVSIGLPCGE